jgi:Family of unknown function (DUF5675)
MFFLTLQRTETGDEGTFGRLTGRVGETEIDYKTMELPWRDNAADVSCIPAGTYRCIWNMSNRFQRLMYLVEGVLNRAGIRFHAANFAGWLAKGLKCDLNGCIALGKEIAPMAGQKALWKSREAMREFEALMAGRPFTLQIFDVAAAAQGSDMV